MLLRAARRIVYRLGSMRKGTPATESCSKGVITDAADPVVQEGDLLGRFERLELQ